MKLTDELTALVVELGRLESFERAGLLIDSQGISINALLELFNETENRRSKQVVREILIEVGCSETLTSDAAPLSAFAQNTAQCRTHDEIVVIRTIPADGVLSEQDFLALSPVNWYLH